MSFDSDAAQAEISLAAKNMAVITLALLGGPLVFFAVCVFFALNGPAHPAESLSQNRDLIQTMCTALAAVTLGTTVMSVFMGQQMSEQALARVYRDGPGGDDAVSGMVAKMNQTLIVRFAMLEGAALFGLVIIFLSTQSGLVQQEPWVWGAVVPLLIEIGFVVPNFPTPERYRRLMVRAREIGEMDS